MQAAPFITRAVFCVWHSRRAVVNNISAVVFDVGNVLFRWDLRCLFEKLIADRQELDWFLANVVTVEWHFQHDAGRSLTEMRDERVAQFPEYAHLIDAYTNRINETIPGVVDGSIEIVEELSISGVPLFAITNFGAEFWDGFHPTQPVFKHFRDIVVSGVEKMMKPDAAIFELALRRFGLAPGLGLFIDDNIANVESARKNGFVSYHFTDAVSLRAELESLGLLAPSKKAFA
jgi:2-haloacid dehalogenase